MNSPSEVWERITRAPLFLDQTDKVLELDWQQIEQHYYPLAVHLLTTREEIGRLMVAVAGPPGSGKSAFAAILAETLTALTDGSSAAVIGLDGWHLPNEVLDSRLVEWQGKLIPLRRRKGSPESFDISAALMCLKDIRATGRGEFPVYSRALHAPVPGAGRVTPDQRVVIVEGNYLLMEEEGWRSISLLFDLSIYLNTPLEGILAGLEARHRRGGKTAEEIERQIREVDVPNARRVSASISQADIIVHKTDNQTIARLEGL
jgi:pantothenate kinase